jgi:hypothetical protein
MQLEQPLTTRLEQLLTTRLEPLTTRLEPQIIGLETPRSIF